MKVRTTVALILTAGCLQALSARADDLFAMAWRGTAWTRNDKGQIASRAISEQTFVKQVAQNNGLDPKTLVFVYRPDKHDTAVVRRANGEFVADVIQMEYSFTDVSNSAGNTAVRQAFLFDEAHSGAIGSAFGTERQSRSKDGALLTASFSGTFQYATPESATVYSGSFSTGARIRDTSGG